MSESHNIKKEIKSQKKKKKKKGNLKKYDHKKFSELKTVRTRSMSVSDNVSVTQSQNLVNARVR